MLRPMNRPETIAKIGTHSARKGRIGVLIANLGTPEATDAGSVRRYLREFLSDARVIENQGLVWKFVLNAIILPRRPARQRPRLRQDLESRAQRIAAEDASRARRPPSFAPPSRRSIRPSWSIGRCAMASRRSAPASRRWPRPAASASCCCRSIRNTPPRPPRRSATRPLPRWRGMRDQPALRVVPPYYDDDGLYRGAGVLHRGRVEAPAVQARADPRVVPRHPEILRGRRRSLSEPLRAKPCGCCASG